MIEKVVKIQNKSKSLMWGCTRHSETEVLFAVGHKSYPLEVLYFIVDEDYAVSLIDQYHKKVLEKQCDDETEMLGVIVEMLKTHFPAKGVANQ